jgi:hypothetical protein
VLIPGRVLRDLLRAGGDDDGDGDVSASTSSPAVYSTDSILGVGGSGGSLRENNMVFLFCCILFIKVLRRVTGVKMKWIMCFSFVPRGKIFFKNFKNI